MRIVDCVLFVEFTPLRPGKIHLNTSTFKVSHLIYQRFYYLIPLSVFVPSSGPMSFPVKIITGQMYLRRSYVLCVYIYHRVTGIVKKRQRSVTNRNRVMSLFTTSVLILKISLNS